MIAFRWTGLAAACCLTMSCFGYAMLARGSLRMSYVGFGPLARGSLTMSYFGFGRCSAA